MMMLPLMSAGLLLRVEQKDAHIAVRPAFPPPVGHQILFLFLSFLFEQDEKAAIAHTHRHTLPQRNLGCVAGLL